MAGDLTEVDANERVATADPQRSFIVGVAFMNDGIGSKVPSELTDDVGQWAPGPDTSGLTRDLANPECVQGIGVADLCEKSSGT